MAGDIIREQPYLFLGSRLKRLAEQMQGDVARVSERAGLPVQPGQYPLLATLDRYGAQTIGALARALGLSQPSVTRVVLRLATAGLVAIDRRHRDQRHKTVALTPAGAAVMAQSKAQVWPQVEAAVREVSAGLAGPLLEQVATLEARLADRSLAERAAAALVLAQAEDADIPAIAALMNRAFRGGGAVGTDAGWLTSSACSSSTIRRWASAACR